MPMVVHLLGEVVLTAAGAFGLNINLVPQFKLMSTTSCLYFILFILFVSPYPVQALESSVERDCSGYAYVPPFPSVPETYTRRYNTIAHQFLDSERNVGPVTASEYAVLDAILDEAKVRLLPIPPGLEDLEYEHFAVKSLKTVDCILVSHGFVYPGKGLVQLLSDGLDPTIFTDKNYYRALLDSSHNSGRTTFIEMRRPGPYYVVDCDIASYIYLAVGEIMNYPLSMVQLPKHNFIRWLRSSGYVDFETMDGKRTDDAYYYALWHIPPKFIGTPGVLTTMSDAQLRAYEHFSIAIAYTWKHDYVSAISEYENSISVDATLADAENNLAWLYTVVPDVILRDAKKAVSHAEHAAAIFPDGDHLDTLACAHALAGNYAKAIAIQSRAINVGWAPQGSNVSDDLVALSNGHGCQDSSFGIDQNPFRQRAPTSE